MTSHTPSSEIPSWHALPPHEVLSLQGSKVEGLDEAEASTRLKSHGPNALPGAPPPGLAKIILRQFTSPLIYILIAAMIISIVLAEFVDAGFIAIIIVINAVIGSWQESRAERSAEALRSLLSDTCTVRRGGRLRTVDVRCVVPGDIVLLESGVRVPADLRLLSATELGIEEALLTGESIPADKAANVELPPQLAVAERRTIAHAGTMVIRGRGEGVVIATARDTALGEIARDVLEAESGKPPLLERIEKLSRRIGWVAIVATMGVGLGGIALGSDPGEMLLVALTLAVSAIPEGLPIAITVALAVAVRRMAKKGVIVRRLAAVEGLGSCTFIGSDKTGTLTCNAMTARDLVLANDATLQVTGEGFAPDGEVQGVEDEETDDLLQRMVVISARCNEASLDIDEEAPEQWKWRGDPTEIALLTLARKVQPEIDTVHEQYPDVHQIPFESERRYAATFVEADGGERILLKGSPEIVLGMCNLDDDRRRRWEEKSRALAARGLRVLAFADGSVEEGLYDEEHWHKRLDFVGFVGLIDPLRPGVVDAVAACKRAGIEVAMITGDHPVTASAIGEELGLADSPIRAIHGDELLDLNDDEFREIVETHRVFARVSPAQKLAIVETARNLGHYVAVTGDGANDAPALKAANIGVAMGQSGTDVAREAAELVITDDNFATIVSGVEEGRVAYDNVRKVFTLLGSTGLAEIFTVGAAIFAGLPLPLLPLQILWLNLVTNGIQDKALAVEPAEGDVLDKPPRNPERGILDGPMIAQIFVASAFMALGALAVFYYLLSEGYAEEVARSSVLMLMVFFQNVHLFNCRSELNSAFSIPIWKSPWLLVAAGSALGVHLIAGSIPFLADVLHLAPIPAEVFAILIPLALALIVVMEVYKKIARPIILARTSPKSTHG